MTKDCLPEAMTIMKIRHFLPQDKRKIAGKSNVSIAKRRAISKQIVGQKEEERKARGQMVENLRREVATLLPQLQTRKKRTWNLGQQFWPKKKKVAIPKMKINLGPQ
jgi:hypothetical protein